MMGRAQHSGDLGRTRGAMPYQLSVNASKGRTHLRELGADGTQGTLLRLLFLLANGKYGREGELAGHGLRGKRDQQALCVNEAAEVACILPQKGIQRGQHFKRPVQLRVGAALVGPDAHQIFGARVST